jgi:hypothetical protein
VQSEEIEARIGPREGSKDGDAVMNAPTKSELQERIELLEAQLEEVKAEKAKVPFRTRGILKELARYNDRKVANLAQAALKDLV